MPPTIHAVTPEVGVVTVTKIHIGCDDGCPAGGDFVADGIQDVIRVVSLAAQAEEGTPFRITTVESSVPKGEGHPRGIDRGSMISRDPESEVTGGRIREPKCIKKGACAHASGVCALRAALIDTLGIGPAPTARR